MLNTLEKCKHRMVIDVLFLLCGQYYVILMFWFGLGYVNATFNNTAVISRRSVQLVEEIGENHQPASNHRQTLTHNVVSSTPRHERGSSSQF